MKHYYIEINGRHSEPLTFEALKSYHITLDTLIWSEGMTQPNKAGNIPELAELFRTTPPRIQNASIPPLTRPNAANEAVPAYHAAFPFGADVFKKALIGGFLIAALVVLVFSFADNTHANAQTQTGQDTRQPTEQQQLIEEQHAKIAEQERLENEKQERERKTAIEKQINDISAQLRTAYTNAAKAKERVNNTSGFKLLRSRGERNEGINTAAAELESWEKEVKRLEGALRRLNAL
jgi:uncharacterized protein DUF4339